MARRGQFYAGSKLLQCLVPVIGLPLDQCNFLVCQALGLLLAIPFRTVLSPTSTSPKVRLVVELVAGIALTVFCFGHQVWYLVGQSLVSYLLMKYGSPRWSQGAVFAYCMVYLAIAHISRQFYDYGGYTLDITGPMMIQTQKLTSLAFALSDGHRDQSKLSQDQKSQSIREVPDVLSFFSFMFYFHGVMCGPLSFYSDYMAFIDGSDVRVPPPSSTPPASCSNGHTENLQDITGSERDLKNFPVFLKRLVTALVCGGLMVTLPPLLCPPEGLLEPSFFEKTFLQKTFYILITMTVSRQKYYFAWILGEALNLAAGFGFSGYDSAGQPSWDLMENVSIWDVEFANSLKTNIDGWNKRTLVWLRRVVYDRAPSRSKTMAVFSVSAFWHGFYPGYYLTFGTAALLTIAARLPSGMASTRASYYLTFGTAALLTIAARLVRRNVRPSFQGTERKRYMYDTFTFIFARIANFYIAFPFLTLEFMTSLRVYAAQYFWLHLAALAVIVYFTFISPAPPRSKDTRSKEASKQD